MLWMLITGRNNDNVLGLAGDMLIGVTAAWIEHAPHWPDKPYDVMVSGPATPNGKVRVASFETAEQAGNLLQSLRAYLPSGSSHMTFNVSQS